MFSEVLYRFLTSTGVEVRDIEKLLSASGWMDSDQILAVSDFFILNKNANIFFTKVFDRLSVSVDVRGNTIIYLFKNPMNRILSAIKVSVDAKKITVFTLGHIITVGNSLYDYRDDLYPEDVDLSMYIMNHFLIKYSSMTIYALYRLI